MSRRSALPAAFAACFALAAPSAALADDSPEAFTGETVTVADTAATDATCQDPVVSPLLAELGDPRDYFVVPGADFEQGAAGWQLDRGATLTLGSSTLGVPSLTGGSLRLPAGASATSPAFCVDERFPTFRFFLGNFSARARADVDVEVIYPGTADNVREAGTVVSKPLGWALSQDIDLKPEYGAKVGGWRKVALRFVGSDDTASQTRIDDVVVDPRMR
jgi:hypothetical protein